VEVERLLARVQAREVHDLRPELDELRRGGGRLGGGGGVRVREEAAAALAEVPALGAVQRLLVEGWLRLAVGVGGGGFGGIGVRGAVHDEVVVERVGSRGERQEAAREAEQRRGGGGPRGQQRRPRRRRHGSRSRRHSCPSGARAARYRFGEGRPES